MYVIRGDKILKYCPESKFGFPYAHAERMSELRYKFQIPASSTVGGDAETRTVLQCDMIQNMHVI